MIDLRIKNTYFLKKDGKAFILVPLSPRQIYKDQIKLKKKGKAESLEQPCEDVRKSDTHGSIERTSLGKVEKNRVLAERGKKKKNVRK